MSRLLEVEQGGAATQRSFRVVRSNGVFESRLRIKLARKRVWDRSIKLLERWLSPRQLEQWAQPPCLQHYSFFTVVGENTGHEYELWGFDAGFNIFDCTSYRVLCVGPGVPFRGVPGDTLLSQKLALENNELETLERANVIDDAGRKTFVGTLHRCRIVRRGRGEGL